jgi:S-adenosylmethionine hydrolase
LIFNFAAYYIRGVQLVTFTSDFGLSDPYVGEVKGVVAALAPQVRVIDISHDIEPGNLLQGSFVIAGSFRYFTAGTVHLVVVDPGVGTPRGILVVQTRQYRFIGPDNGVLYEAVQRSGLEKLFELDTVRLYEELQARFPGNSVVEHLLQTGTSSTFHGRDLFAPLTAYLCSGYPLEAVAKRREELERLVIPAPVQTETSVAGRIIYIDRFGNLVTNIPDAYVDRDDEVFIKARNELSLVGRIAETYADVQTGTPLALIGSRGNLEIALNRGSAREYFDAASGDEILVMKGEGRT